MKFLIIFLSTLLLLLLLPSSYSLPQEEFEIIKQVFLLAGQSNMQGQGGVDSKTNVWDKYVPPECTPSPQILRLNKDLEWEEATEPLHRGVENGSGVGPGMPFSNALLKRDPLFVGKIGLVPAARGQTNVSMWQRGGFLYNRLLQRAGAAVRGGGVIRAMLWYQGENDANPQEAPFYEARLRQFFTDLRSDLGLPLLPIIQVALNPDGILDRVNVQVIRRVQLEFDMPLVKCVDAKGLELEPDRIHLSTNAQVGLGEMLADAYLCLVDF